MVVDDSKLGTLLLESTRMLDKLSTSVGCSRQDINQFGNAVLAVQDEVHKVDAQSNQINLFT